MKVLTVNESRKIRRLVKNRLSLINLDVIEAGQCALSLREILSHAYEDSADSASFPSPQSQVILGAELGRASYLAPYGIVQNSKPEGLPYSVKFYWH